MSNLTTDQWSQIFTRAVRDSAFRSQLLNSPKEAARSIGIDLEEGTFYTLTTTLNELRKLGANTELDEVAAKEWVLRPLHHSHLPTSGLGGRKVAVKKTVRKKTGAKKSGRKKSGGKKR